MLSPVVAAIVFPHDYWTMTALTALLGGFLCLDETSAFQTWLAQPLPAALLTGLIWGRPEIGLAVGFPLQMVLMGNLPVGQSFVCDPVTAVVSVTGAACRIPLTGIMLFPGSGQPAFALWGWLLLGAGLLSLAGHWLVFLEREAFGYWMYQGRLSLRDGNPRRLESLHWRCLGLTFLRGVVFTLVFLLLVQDAWVRIFSLLGDFWRSALGLLPFVLPGIGIGTILEQFGWRRCWPLVTVGVLGALFLVEVLGV